MKNECTYLLTIERDEAGFYLATFPDVPEAGTDDDTAAGALAEALDSLIAALGGYINAWREIPKPSPVMPGQQAITLPSLVAAKLALYQGMREAGLTCVELGYRLSVGEAAVRRLLDLDHQSPVRQLEAALKLLGRRLVVTVEEA